MRQRTVSHEDDFSSVKSVVFMISFPEPSIPALKQYTIESSSKLASMIKVILLKMEKFLFHFITARIIFPIEAPSKPLMMAVITTPRKIYSPLPQNEE